MKKNYSLITFLLLTVVGAVAVQACSSATFIEPSNKMQSQSYNYANFDEIKVSSTFEVQYQQSADNSWSVEISAPDNIMPYVVVKQHEDGISLSLKDGISARKNYNLKAKIVAPSLEEIDLSGAASFVADNVNNAGRGIELNGSGASSFLIKTIVASEVEVDLSGASKLQVSNIDTRELDIDASGASDATIAGKAQKVEFQASGASSINAKSLKAQVGELKASGASDINSSVANVLQQSSSGGSTIKNN